MIFNDYPDREMMMIALANKLAGELKNTLLTHETASFAVCGGTTPGPVFDALSGVDLNWSRIRVIPTDERWVPETDPRSNAALIRERLLTSRAAMAEFVPLYAETETPEDALETLTAAVAPLLPVSVLLLGMGEDMHTASLFPGGDRLISALKDDAPPLVAMRAPAAPEPRVSLTAPVLRGAMSTHVVITGEAKRAAIEAAQKLPPEKAPIRTVLGSATVHWAA